jgi:hypothetical protein
MKERFVRFGAVAFTEHVIRAVFASHGISMFVIVLKDHLDELASDLLFFGFKPCADYPDIKSQCIH